VSADPVSRGREALERADWPAARDAFAEALAGGESPEALEGLTLAGYWLFDGEATFRSGERAYSLYRKGGDARGAGRTALWLALASVYLRGEHAVGNGWLERATRLLAGEVPCAEQALLALALGHFALLRDHDLARAAGHTAAAAALARRLGAGEYELFAQAQEGLRLVTAGQIAEGMALLDGAAAAAVGGELADPIVVTTVCCYLIYACKRVHDYGRAAEWCDRTKELSERFGDRVTFAACRTHYADILILRGSFAEADEELAANLRELAALGPGRAPDGLVRLAELRRRQGRLDEAARLAAQSEGHARAPLVRAWLALDLGDAAAAADHAERLLRRIPPAERTERVQALEPLVRAHAALGELDEAEEARAELEAIARAVGTVPLQAAAVAAGGAVALALGDAEAARRRLEDAVDLYRAGGAPFEAAQARLELARALAEAGRAARAAEEAETARAELDRLGAEHERRRAVALLRSLGIAVPAAASEPAGLTPREREVLALLARGRSNQEIAGELVLSVRTVERHIANLYDKIGAVGRTARATATAYAFSRGLVVSRDT
jgi:DNA-binding NarL/FixJ family response regulator